MSNNLVKTSNLLYKPYTGKILTKLTNGRINPNVQRQWIHRKYINLIPESPTSGQPRIFFLPTIHEFIIADQISQLGIKLAFAKYIILERLKSILAEKAKITGQVEPNLSKILKEPSKWYGGEFINRDSKRYWVVSCINNSLEVRIVGKQNLDEIIFSHPNSFIIIPITDLLSYTDIKLSEEQ